MYDSMREVVAAERAHRFQLTRAGAPLTYASTLELWQTDAAFRAFFLDLLSESPFSAFRWETPPLTSATVDRPFEFVLLNCPSLTRPADQQAYADYFTTEPVDEGVVAFENLGGDATLVVPSPRAATAHYVHLAAFVRGAPAAQQHALWQVVGRTVQRQLSRRPLWLSTAGGGVAWLHVRLDSRPKYYGYAPYTKAL